MESTMTENEQPQPTETAPETAPVSTGEDPFKLRVETLQEEIGILKEQNARLNNRLDECLRHIKESNAEARSYIDKATGTFTDRIVALEQNRGPRIAGDPEDTVDADARRAIDHIAVHISNDGTDIRQCVTNILTGKPPHGEDGKPNYVKY